MIFVPAITIYNTGADAMLWWGIFGIYYLVGMIYIHWMFKEISDFLEEIDEYEMTQEEINAVNELEKEKGFSIWTRCFVVVADNG